RGGVGGAGGAGDAKPGGVADGDAGEGRSGAGGDGVLARRREQEPTEEGGDEVVAAAEQRDDGPRDEQPAEELAGLRRPVGGVQAVAGAAPHGRRQDAAPVERSGGQEVEDGEDAVYD